MRVESLKIEIELCTERLFRKIDAYQENEMKRLKSKGDELSKLENLCQQSTNDFEKMLKIQRDLHDELKRDERKEEGECVKPKPKLRCITNRVKEADNLKVTMIGYLTGPLLRPSLEKFQTAENNFIEVVDLREKFKSVCGLADFSEQIFFGQSNGWCFKYYYALSLILFGF